MTETPPDLRFDQFQYLQRNSRRAAVISLVGGLIVLLWLGLSVLGLQQSRAALASEIATLDTTKKDLDRQIAQRRALAMELNAQIDDVGLAQAKLAQDQPEAAVAILEAISSKPPVSAGARPVVDRANVARVYFQIRARAQAMQYQTCVSPLTAAGYRVPDYEVVDQGPRRAELRYFHPEEEDRAKALQQTLQTCLRMPVALVRLTLNDVNPLHFEVWLADS